jgi:hypothetical protein
MGLPRPMFWWKGHNPPRYESAKMPLVECPPLLQCKSSDLSLPLLGSQHPFGGILAPWRSEIIISPCVPTHKGHKGTCPLGMILKHQHIRPPWAHKSQGSQKFQSHLIIKLLNMCIKPLLLGQVLKDIILIYKPSLEETLGRPIGLMLTGCGMFLGEIKSKPCGWMRWKGMSRQGVK